MKSSVWLARAVQIVTVTVAIITLVPSPALAQEWTCMDYTPDGCGHPTGKYTCLVTPGQDAGWSYWPYQPPPEGMQCRDGCPNAPCHSQHVHGDALGQQHHLLSLNSEVTVALRAGDVAALLRLVQTQPGVTLNFERRAVQVTSGCSESLMVAHLPLGEQHLARLVSRFAHSLYAPGSDRPAVLVDEGDPQ